jgi:general secretion pathway protein A
MSYYRQFGLSNPPFEMVSKPNSLYMSKAHREGLAALEWGLLHEPGHFTLLMGQAGTGKTTLINVLLDRHFQCIANADGQAIYSIRTSDLARIAYVMNPKLGFEEMLRLVLEQLGYPPSATTKPELLRKFEWLFGELRPRERIAIIIDEAQALSDETLEDLRMFSNYSERGKGHLEILLVGQPELLTRLMDPSLRQFHQRIGARAILNPLQREEAFEYIEHKLQESGGSTKRVFGKRALQILVHHSHGIPRQLNLLCNNALIRAYASDLRIVTMKVAREAIREFENLAGTGEKFREPIGRRALHSITSHPAISSAGVSLIAMLGLYSLWVPIPSIRPVISEVAKRNVTPHLITPLIGTGNAGPIGKVPAHSVEEAALSHSIANDPLARPSQHLANNVAAKHLADEVASPPGSTPSLSVVNRNRAAQSKSREAGSYEVQEGDTLEGIALQHIGSTIQSLRAANPQLRDANRIYPGDTIFLPAGTALRPSSGNELSDGLKSERNDAPAPSQ